MQGSAAPAASVLPAAEEAGEQSIWELEYPAAGAFEYVDDFEVLEALTGSPPPLDGSFKSVPEALVAR